MDKKKINAYIEKLQEMANELNNLQDDISMQTASENTQTNFELEKEYFHIYNIDDVGNKQLGIVGLDYETVLYVEADYIGILEQQGLSGQEVDSCIMYLYGRTRTHHESYDIYSMDTGEYIYTEKSIYGSIMSYPIDLKRIYEATGNTNFKVIVDEDFGAESMYAAKTTVILNGEQLQFGISSIEIESAPFKTNYIEGEYFDKTGMGVVAVMANGTRISVSDYTVSPTSALTASDNCVLICYKGLYARIEISVGTFKGIKITTPPYKLLYFVGDKFDSSGIEVCSLYSNGRTGEIDYSKLTYPDSVLVAGQNSVKLSYNGKTDEQKILVLPTYNLNKPSYLNTSENYSFYDEVNNYRTFNLLNDTAFSVNLLKKSLVFTFKDVWGEDTLLGLNVTHVYRPNRNNIGYGCGFSLSVCEQLIEENSKLYYVDEIGDWYKVVNDIAKNMKYTTIAPASVSNNSMYKFYLDQYQGADRDKLLPVKWLVDGNLVRGFNKEGLLNFINDSYDNFYMIEYNSRNQITYIHDLRANIGVNTYIFDYDNLNNLVQIKDLFRTINFSYKDGYVHKITYSDGVSLSLSYQNGIISQIESSDGYISKIYVDKDCKLTVTSQSSLNKIPDGEVSSSLPVIYKYQIFFNDNAVQISDLEGDKEYFKFKNSLYISAHYVERNNVICAAEEYEYVPKAYKKVNKAKEDTLNKTSYSNFIFNTGETGKITLDEFNKPTRCENNNILISDGVFADSVTDYTYNNVFLTKTQTVFTYNFDKPEKYTLITDFEYNEKGKIIKKSSYISEEVETEGKTVEEYAYDERGYNVSVNKYNSIDMMSLYSGQTYNSFGRVASIYDDLGRFETKFSYDASSNRLSAKTFPKGGVVNYSYDGDSHKLTGVSSETEKGVLNQNSISYENDEISQLSDSGSSIRFTYDSERRLSSVIIDGVEYEKFEYSTRDSNGNLLNNRTATVVNAKNEKFKVVENKSLRNVKVYYNDTIQLELNYNLDGTVYSASDKLTGEVANYTYNDRGQLTSCIVSNNKETIFTESCEYNSYGELYKEKYSGISEISYQYDYSDNFARNLNKITIDSSITVSPKYDRLGIYTGKTVGSGGSAVYSDKIEFDKIINKQSFRPSNITYTFADNSSKRISYGYDRNGNISLIRDMDGTEILYYYDNLNRLVREDNKHFNYTYLYSYDEKGNLTSKQIKFLALYEPPEPMGIDEVKYFYFSGKLMKVDDNPSVYDAIGNPTQFNNQLFEWKGKQLIFARSTKSITGIAFTYDGRGRRISKGDTRYYYDDNDRLIKSSDGMEYFYDHQGVTGFKYEGEVYYYLRDVQNNIKAILDSSGKIVVEYYYDAWGNQKNIDNSGKGLSVKNPFRYRGYFYDPETKLYYLNSRYYDPYVGRFINMDSIDYADPTTLNGLNLYAYCNNNPVMNLDPSGHFAITATIMSLLAVAFFAAALGWIELTWHPLQNLVESINFSFNSPDVIIGSNSNSSIIDSISINQIDTINNNYNIQILYAKKETYKPKRRGKRVKGKSKKDAEEKARRRGRGKLPRHHKGGYNKEGKWINPHFHPGVPENHPFYHDHYFYILFILLGLDFDE